MFIMEKISIKIFNVVIFYIDVYIIFRMKEKRHFYLKKRSFFSKVSDRNRVILVASFNLLSVS